MRSTHNVGSLLRTAEGIGVEKVYFTGYTPYPQQSKDTRLPHISSKLDAQISKTALGAEKSQIWEYYEDIEEVLTELTQAGVTIAALEQTATSTPLPDYVPPEKIAILLGEEVEGIPEHLLTQTDIQLEIPMFGAKESFNVVQAAAMLMYALRFYR